MPNSVPLKKKVVPDPPDPPDPSIHLTRAWELKTGNAGIKLTYLAMAAFPPDHPDGWLFTATIIDRVGVLNGQVVSRNLKTLHAFGIVERDTVNRWLMWRLKEKPGVEDE